MGRRLGHLVGVAGAVVVAAVAAAVQDPYVLHVIATHPLLAAWFPTVSGLVYAGYKAWRDRQGAGAASAIAPPSSGSPSMGAK